MQEIEFNVGQLLVDKNNDIYEIIMEVTEYWIKALDILENGTYTYSYMVDPIFSEIESGSIKLYKIK